MLHVNSNGAKVFIKENGRIHFNFAFSLFWLHTNQIVAIIYMNRCRLSNDDWWRRDLFAIALWIGHTRLLDHWNIENNELELIDCDKRRQDKSCLDVGLIFETIAKTRQSLTRPYKLCYLIHRFIYCNVKMRPNNNCFYFFAQFGFWRRERFGQQ